MNPESKIIIYGAGKRGKQFYNFIKQRNGQNNVYAFCDENYKNIKEIDGKKVVSFDEACEYGLPFFISIVETDISKGIREKIEKRNATCVDAGYFADLLDEDRVSFNRDFCAFFHLEGMDQYFDSAESNAGISVFWGENSPFLNMFEKLDLDNVIELACGRGRHVPHYLHKAGTITLVDILQKNIDICKTRFKDEKGICYYCNNGYNLNELESEKYTALFCYDAMVHFEMMDIYEYLKDIYRVLVSGGRVLIHHSNNTSDYKASFANAPHGRSFMSKDIFAYLAYRCGFKIIEQKEIDWGVENLDCISLLQK